MKTLQTGSIATVLMCAFGVTAAAEREPSIPVQLRESGSYERMIVATDKPVVLADLVGGADLVVEGFLAAQRLVPRFGRGAHLHGLFVHADRHREEPAPARAAESGALDCRAARERHGRRRRPSRHDDRERLSAVRRERPVSPVPQGDDRAEHVCGDRGRQRRIRSRRRDRANALVARRCFSRACRASRSSAK